jgi:hypothetical protein
LHEKKNPLPGWSRQRVLGIVLRLDYLYDRQPATVVVVMPVRMMAAIGAKHCTRLIPDSAGDCQIFATDFHGLTQIQSVFIREIRASN